MEISLSENKDRWNQFLIENRGSFLQSWQWGEFQKNLPKKIWRFVVFRLPHNLEGKEEILSQAQIIKENFPMKSFLYLPYSPCFKDNLFLKDKKKILKLIIKKAQEVAKKEGAIFLKIEPTSPLAKEPTGVRSSKRIQPQKTLILNLKKTEDEIFKIFHPKTRYNIRLAQRKGVKILFFESKDIKDAHINIFYKLIQKTAKRDRFSPYKKEYYKTMLKIVPSLLFSAKFKEKTIAVNILVFFGKRATYLHGGANYKYRKVMAPHLLQWDQIKEAKKRGFEEYDFWGIDEEKWPGLTRFKKSFNGEEFKYPEGRDFIFKNFWYKVYKFIKEI